MDRSEKAVLTNMCMVCDDKGNVLVLDKTDPAYHGITFPGGHVEKEESFTDAVIREIFEETGLTVRCPQLCGIKQWQQEETGARYIVLLYKTTQFSGTLCASEEGRVFWTPLNKLHTLHLAEDMADMLHVFTEDNISEFYYLPQSSFEYVLK